MKSNVVKKRFLFISSILSIVLIFTLSTAVTSFAARNFTVTTGSTSYAEHSTVRITLTNTGNESLRLVNMWWMVEVRSGGTVREVYTGDPQKPPGAPDILAPGEQTTWTWNAKDNEGSWQPAGRYRIKVHITMPQLGYEATKVSDGFDLTAAAERLEISVTSNRKKYNSGDIVTFSIRNTGTRALDTSRFTWIIYRLYSSGPVERSTHNSKPSAVPDPLDVGASASWSWDGRNNSGGFVNPANYELEVQLLDEGIEGNCFFKVE